MTTKYNPIPDAIVIARDLSMEDIAYAGDPARKDYRGFAALHDRCDANELLLADHLEIGPFPAYESCQPDCTVPDCGACLEAEEALFQSGKQEAWAERATDLCNVITAIIVGVWNRLDDTLLDDDMWADHKWSVSQDLIEGGTDDTST